MSSSNRLKNNGTRLNRLIIDKGTETVRKYFDSKHPPTALTATLNARRATLQGLRRSGVIKAEQMNLLFPPAGMPPTTSKDYDITLLFILIRNICGLTPPATGWVNDPAPIDKSVLADLIRIKNFRNKVFAHKKNTEVTDTAFHTHWNGISSVLIRISKNLKLPDPSVEIAYLKTCSLGEDRPIILFIRYLGILLIFLFIRNNFLREDYNHSQNFSDPGFVGREWIFRELESICYSSDVRGVHLVADSGWGKSAIMRHLINSPSSSPVIHENIIGHYFCKYNKKSTRDGEKFVTSLVQLIFKRIPESRVQLDSNCTKNPIECFRKVIVYPLQKLNGTGRNVSFLFIDALDECLEKGKVNSSIILKILCDNVPNLPKWVKLIVTSRKLALTTGIVSNIDKFSTMEVDVTDQRNELDLRNYATKTIFAQNFRTEIPIERKIHLMNLINLALESCKGRFLYLVTIIKHWQKYPGEMNARSIPDSLIDIYIASFAKRFNEGDIDHFEPLLEVLLATNSPLTLFELEKVLYIHNKTYNTRKVAKKLSEFFKSDIDEEPLEFYHQSLAEWLTEQTNGTNGIYIQEWRGHQYIVDYLFHFFKENQTNLTFKELSELCKHILHAGEKAIDANIINLSSLNVSEVRDLYQKRCILHDLASKRDATKIIAAIIKQFNSVDILDNGGWTPAMDAVYADSYENVKLFIDNGANVNHTRKCTDCNWWDHLHLDDRNPSMYFSMSSVAAYKGYSNIAELLLRSGAEIEKMDECGWKPLYIAAAEGHFEIVKLYKNNGAQADAITLHHAAAGNHTEIVKFLLSNGIRDTCLPCKSGNMSWCEHNLSRFHHCFCETALFAAVSKNSLEITRLILQYGNASVDCKHGSGRTPLTEALFQRNTQMAELLVNARANFYVECECSTLYMLYNNCDQESFRKEYLYAQSDCIYPVCYSGNPNFELAHGLLTDFSFEQHNPSLSIVDMQWSVATVAAIGDQVDFINSTYGKRVNSIPNIETTLRYVAVCHSLETLKHLLNSKDWGKFSTVYEDGKTLLHFAALGSSNFVTEDYVTRSCTSFACVCPKNAHADIVDQKRLETITLLTKILVLEINKRDIYGRTALHYAAVHASPRIVEVLMKEGADWSIQDERGDTALEYALRERPADFETSLPCRWTSDRVFRVCNSTLFDEMSNYLVQNAAIRKCDVRAKKMLDVLLYHGLPLSLYALFKSGLDVNCAHEHFKKYLNILVYEGTFWWERLDEFLEVFKIFQIDVEVICGVPFAESELHLQSYLQPFKVKVGRVGNLFQPSVNGSFFPLERFITSHPKGVNIFSECYDKEGYLPIHRALQGDNVDAVSWFIEIGVDVSRKTRSGLSALALATHGYPSSQYFVRERRIYDMLLEKTKEKLPGSFHCNTELTDLSPLHVAGSRGIGMLEVIHRKIPELALNCTNIDGIQPIYLAYLKHAIEKFPGLEDEQAIKNLHLSPDTAPLKYPKREAEYHLIYNQFFPTPQYRLQNVSDQEGLFECPSINELLPHKTVIKYYLKVNECATRCRKVAFEAHRSFLLNFPYLDIQGNISNPFTYSFNDIAAHLAELRFHLVKMFHFSSFRYISISTLEKKLWQKITKAYSCAHNCSCFEMMLLLQKTFTNKHRLRNIKIGLFVAERMDWTDTSLHGDVRYRWPFSFLLKKALRIDKAYQYLEILGSHWTYDF